MGSWLCLISIVMAAAEPPSGRIAYLAGSNPDELCVHVLDLPTKNDSRIGPGQNDCAPVWSPDGAWLAFSTRQSGNMGIVVAKPDGSETRPLVHASEWNVFPQWSPDGHMLAYENGDDFTQSIVVWNMDTNTETIWGGGAKGLMRPAWLPTFKLLSTLNSDPRVKNGNAALDQIKSGPVIIAVGIEGPPNARSTGLFFVTPEAVVPFPQEALPSDEGKYAEWSARPSPNGSRLVFESNDGGDRELFCYTRERAVDISNHRAADWNPVWSPDSRWLAFESFRGGRRGVYRIYTDTARVSPVAASPDYDNWAPTWSPDGKWLAYVSNQTGDPEIYVSDTAGAHTVRLTEHPGLDYAPAWCPKGDTP